MNNLSWLIYLAEVVGKTALALQFVTFVCGLGTLISAIVYAISLAEDADEIAAGAKKIISPLVIGLSLAGVVNCVIPSREAVMMIAASELGEKVIASPAVAGVVDPSIELLKTWIARTTEDLKTRK